MYNNCLFLKAIDVVTSAIFKDPTLQIIKEKSVGENLKELYWMTACCIN